MSGRIYVHDRAIVYPGDLIAEGDFSVPWSPYIQKAHNKYYSTVIGLVEVKDNYFSVIPLKGSKYMPKVGDLVIGMVTDLDVLGWEIDIRAPYSSYLPASSLLGRPVSPSEDLKRYLNTGDYVLCKIEAYDRSTNPILSIKGKGLGRISHGVVIEISPNKVARVIGKNKSMLNNLMTHTACEITVAQNGRIWANCPSKQMEDLLIIAIETIERESYIKGLTDKISQMLKEKKGEFNAKA